MAKSEGGKEASINSPTSGMLRPGIRVKFISSHKLNLLISFFSSLLFFFSSLISSVFFLLSFVQPCNYLLVKNESGGTSGILEVVTLYCESKSDLQALIVATKLNKDRNK